MKGGDISNETPPRIIVLIDVVAETELAEKRKGLRTVQIRKVTSLNNLALTTLWNMSSKFGLSVELAGLENDLWTQEHLDKVMDKLERRGGNPFNYAELYASVEDLVSELPYRTNLKGVVDVVGRVARYGSYGLEIQNL